MDVEALRGGEAAQGEGHGTASGGDDPALHLQSVHLVQGLDDGHRLGAEALVLPRILEVGPLLFHLQTQVHVVLGDGVEHPVRVVVVKAADVVALLVQLLAGQVRHLVDVIQVVEAVPVLLKGEAAGELRLQLLFLVGGDAHHHQGYPQGFGVVLHHLQGRGQRACPRGEEEALTQAAQQAHHHPVPHPAILLGIGAAPQIHAVEVVLTAHAAGVLKQRGRPLAVLQFRCHKFTLATHTKITSFVRFPAEILTYFIS